VRQVEAENSNIIGIICSIVVASLVIGVIILDIPSSFTGHYFMRHSLLTTVILDIPSLYWTFLSHSLDIPLSDIHCSPLCHTGHSFVIHWTFFYETFITHHSVILDIPSLYWTFLRHSLDIPLRDIHYSPLCHTGHSFIILDIPSSFTGHYFMRHSLLTTLSYWTFLHYTGHSLVIHWTFLYQTFIAHHSVILDIPSLYWTFLRHSLDILL